MAENSKIEWCDHTFNPWIGCSKVHQGCANCYAEADFDKRRHRAQWGPAGTRVLTSETTWSQPLKWDKWARDGVCPRCKGKGGVKVDGDSLPCRRCSGKGNIGPYRARVFCASLADVFENWPGTILNSHGDRVSTTEYSRKFFVGQQAGHDRYATLDDVRAHLFRLIDATPHLDWLLLTKRPENIRRMTPPYEWHACETGDCPHWAASDCNTLDQRKCRENVWLGTSISDQCSADRQIPELLQCRDLSPVLFVSAEPLLGPVDLTNVRLQSGRPINALNANDALVSVGGPSLDWVICGGESGPNARPMHPLWARSLRDQCVYSDVAFHFKQWGEWIPAGQVIDAPSIQDKQLHRWPDGSVSSRLGKKVTGRLLDGREWNELPVAIQEGAE